MVLAYSFDKDNASDESGNKNNGRVQRAKPVTGKAGRAMSFTGAKAEASFFVKHDWTQGVPFFVRAMVLAAGGPNAAGETIFIAGPPDLIDEDEAARRFGDEEIQTKLAEQDAALAGKKGALLWAVSAADGTKLAELPLESPPVWDGMAAAYGRLYLATTDGKVVCLAARQ